MRKIVEVLVDVFETNVNDREYIDNPSWQEVLDAINSFNGKSITSMCICDSDNFILGIGGNKKLCYVNITTPDTSLSFSDNNSDETLSIIIGGVLTKMKKKHLTDFDNAVKIAKLFYNDELDLDAENWVED
jgi:hypothetical protein